jgi:hypothetical protein
MIVQQNGAGDGDGFSASGSFLARLKVPVREVQK